ncbi:RNA polymerase subunit RPO19 [Deerpox virus W-848-83]|uniref:DNA-directed RNA polymerase 19 kDa subunit n=1 Tax=Deerpox virus (strain Mule deer/United States/W-848-83/1983) TaxID=305674 RepID=Q08FP7_DPV83|nr:RNA polymerase subunit RPO19 [Deerpox virus W-848-83]ABI99260.1 RNA polymerase subunit RPO19 [Deerpox virus W-848-83]
MADTDDIIDYESEDDMSEYEEEEDDEDNETKSLESSDVISLKQSNYKAELSTNLEEEVPQPGQSSKNVNSKILAIKKRYTRRISLLEITGIIAESYNLLQRGRLPLISNLSDETMKQKILHIVIQEIEEGTCPIIIEKNGELLSTNDFDKTGLKNHLDYIISIWKNQNRY